MKKITIEYLKKLGASESGMKWYAKNYPDGLTPAELLKAIKPVNESWYVWLIGHSIECAKVPGADINAKDKYGGTPLRLAVSYGKKEIAEFLISKGAK